MLDASGSDARRLLRAFLRLDLHSAVVRAVLTLISHRYCAMRSSWMTHSTQGQHTHRGNSEMNSGCPVNIAVVLYNRKTKHICECPPVDLEFLPAWVGLSKARSWETGPIHDGRNSRSTGGKSQMCFALRLHRTTVIFTGHPEYISEFPQWVYWP